VPPRSRNRRRAYTLYDDTDVAVLVHGLNPPALTHHGTALVFPNPRRQATAASSPLTSWLPTFLAPSISLQ
jgi:hypothetical protein